MKRSAPKNRKLFNQYPFLETIIDWHLVPLELDALPENDSLIIKIERADGDLMYRTATNCGIDDGSHLVGLTGPRKGQVARQAERLVAVAEDGSIINHLSWPGYRAGVRFHKDELPLYAKRIFWSTRLGPEHYTDPIHEKTAYLVWVTVQAWYQDMRDMEQPFGEFVERTLQVTVYRPPREGFDELDRRSCAADHLWLDNIVLAEGIVNNNREITMITGRLDKLAQIFYDLVYSQGMEEILEQAEWKGHSAELGGVSVKACRLMYCGVGVNLSGAGVDLEIQINDESKTMFIGSMQGRLPQIRQVVMAVVRAWQDEEARKHFVPDDSVKNFAQVIFEAQCD